MKETILYTNKLCKTFSNDGVQQHVLRNLDVKIYKGDFTVIMGASGAGKSTLLYALSGMDKPSLGEIFFCGEEISKFSEDAMAVFRRRHCGFVFQQIYMMNKMSLFDNVMTSGVLVNKNKKELAKRVEMLFERVNLEKATYHKFSSQVSGGEAQRAGIVRALINQPSIVFADEPTGALNSTNSDAVLDLLSQFNEDGQSIVMVTHDIKSALRGTRIIYLKDGQICGECNLEAYQKGDKARREQLNTFLNEMGY